MGEWDFYQNIIEIVGLKKYEIASKIGFSEVTLARWFREVPTTERKEEVKRAVNELLAERLEKLNNAIELVTNR